MNNILGVYSNFYLCRQDADDCKENISTCAVAESGIIRRYRLWKDGGRMLKTEKIDQFTYNTLKKLAKKPVAEESACFRIAIVGDTSTQYLATVIRGYGTMTGVPVLVMDADYNQIDAQLMDPNSETYTFQPDMLLLYLSTEWMWHRFCKCPQEQREPAFKDNSNTSIFHL